MSHEPPLSRTLSCLSVRQPWADLILSGIKEVENRTWPTELRELVLIHAPLTVDHTVLPQAARLLGLSVEEYIPVTGAIIGTSELVDCVTEHPSRFFSGPYGFVLRNSRLFAEPVPYRGLPGFFPVPWEDVEQALA